MCSDDGWAAVRGPELMYRLTDRSTIICHIAKKALVFYIILTDHGPDEGNEAINRVAKL